MMGERAYNVLFLCTGNSARSIMAECLMNSSGRGRFKAFSAGSHPRGTVHPAALQLLERLNFSVAGLRSKSWDEFGGPTATPMDFVFTVCDQAAGEDCPSWPGQPMTAHWGVADPALATGTAGEQTAFRDALRLLDARIKLFMSLPIPTLDRIRLKQQLDEIGRATG